MTPPTAEAGGRFYASGEELAQDLATALLGIVPPGPPVQTEAGAAGAVHASIASLIVEPRRATPLEVVMIGGVPGDVERAPFAWSLALALEEAGRRVLIVDADLGISGEHARAQGFVELVRSGAALDGLLRPTGRPRIDLLPPGATPLSAVERCDADELAGAFRAMRSAADVVLLGAPLLSRSGKASRFVAFADSIILVVRLDLDTRDVVRRTYLQLWGVEAPLLGVVSVEAERRPAAPASRSYLLADDALDPARERDAAREARPSSDRAPAPAAGAASGPIGDRDRVVTGSEPPLDAGRDLPDGARPREAAASEPPASAPEPESAVVRAAEAALTAPEPSKSAGPAVPPLPRPPVPVPRARDRSARRSRWILAAAAVLAVAAAALLVPAYLRGPAKPHVGEDARAKAQAASKVSAGSKEPAPAPAATDAATPAARQEPPAPQSAELAQPAGESAGPAGEGQGLEIRQEPPAPSQSGSEDVGAATSELAPDAAPGTNAAPIPAEAGAGQPAAYTLQVASFPDENDALQERARLAPTGYEIRIARVDLAAKGIWYRVFFGRFASEGEARKASEAIQSRGLVKEALLKRLGHEADER